MDICTVPVLMRCLPGGEFWVTYWKTQIHIFNSFTRWDAVFIQWYCLRSHLLPCLSCFILKPLFSHVSFPSKECNHYINIWVLCRSVLGAAAGLSEMSSPRRGRLDNIFTAELISRILCVTKKMDGFSLNRCSWKYGTSLLTKRQNMFGIEISPGAAGSP